MIIVLIISGVCKCSLTPVLASPSDWPESALLPEDMKKCNSVRQSAVRGAFATTTCTHSSTCPGNLAMVAYKADNLAGTYLLLIIPVCQ